MVGFLCAYQITHPHEISFLDVRKNIAIFYLSKNTEITPKRRKLQRNRLMDGRVPNDIKFDPGNYLIVPHREDMRCSRRKLQEFVADVMLDTMIGVLLLFTDPKMYII